MSDLQTTVRALDRGLRRPSVRWLAWLACLGPLLWWVWAGWNDALGANPAETLMRGSGLWTLRFLCIVLAVTPLRQWCGLSALAGWRRMLGLYAFFYATLHALAWAWLDQGLDPEALWRDVGKRPFVLVGFVAWLLLVPLALTSFHRAIRALGAARWKRLHQLVYLIAGLGVVHFLWLRSAKHREGEVLVYGVVVALLLGARWGYRWRQKLRLQPA